MPELPEVEIIKRAVAPQIVEKQVHKVVVRDAMLRWPVPDELQSLQGQTVVDVRRRGKFLLLITPAGTVIIHLGMTGHLFLAGPGAPASKHDHVDIIFEDGQVLRLRDPRKFGAILWTNSDPLAHQLLTNLGPEPLESMFDGPYLFARSRGKKRPVKPYIMDGEVVAGVGNIYASEALFRAGLAPQRMTGELTRSECERLANGIREALTAAISEGENWLKTRGKSPLPHHFHVTTAVYAREGAPCLNCKNPIRRSIIAGRSSYFCPHCQQ